MLKQASCREMRRTASRNAPPTQTCSLHKEETVDGGQVAVISGTIYGWLVVGLLCSFDSKRCRITSTYKTKG